MDPSSSDLLVVIPASVVLSAAGVWLYIVKKRDRQKERIARAHSPRTQGRGKRRGSDPPE